VALDHWMKLTSNRTLDGCINLPHHILCFVTSFRSFRIKPTFQDTPCQTLKTL